MMRRCGTSRDVWTRARRNETCEHHFRDNTRIVLLEAVGLRRALALCPPEAIRNLIQPKTQFFVEAILEEIQHENPS